MKIHTMSEEESFEVLSGMRLARVACTRDNQPYVVPTFFAYYMSPSGFRYLYVVTTLGQKIHWMRSNPLVCVECDEVTSYDQWVSVVAFGVYEELPDNSEFGRERHHAWELLQKDPTWWMNESAAYLARDNPNPTQPFSPLYYRIRIDRITGRRAIPKAASVVSIPSNPSRKSEGWLRTALRRVSGKTILSTDVSTGSRRNDSLALAASSTPASHKKSQTVGATRKPLNFHP